MEGEEGGERPRERGGGGGGGGGLPCVDEAMALAPLPELGSVLLVRRTEGHMVIHRHAHLDALILPRLLPRVQRVLQRVRPR